MKAIKILAGIAFALGLFLILGAAGTSDMMGKLHQPYHFNWLQLIGGVLLMLPLPVIKWRYDR